MSTSSRLPRGGRHAGDALLRPTVRDAGDAALLAELPERIDPMTNGAVLQLAERVRAAGLRGVREVVPAIRSLAVFVDPLHVDIDALRRLLLDRPLEPDVAAEGHRHEVPVVYGGDAGADLADVAAASGLSTDELIARHAKRDYRVYMLGFLPGFAYLGTLDAAIVAARRASPRLRIPTGAVGVAGRTTGIYPQESPGGWALLGRTPLRMFDAGSREPARFAPGDRVRFVPVADAEWPEGDVQSHSQTRGVPSIEVRRSGLLTTVQDTGRWGHQADGVSVAGAMDRVSHRVANALVGNESSAATIEVTVSGPELVCHTDTVVAVAGAHFAVRVDDRTLPPNQSTPVKAGSVVTFGERRSGARAYVSFAGGIDVAPVLGSRSTHTGSGLGGVNGRSIRDGDRLTLAPRGPLPLKRAELPVARVVAGGVRLRVMPGPQIDMFPALALGGLLGHRYTVLPASNRMGFRLSGSTIPPATREMISDVTFPGALQIPPSGEPILLMADRQTTGGYPQLAVVISADMPLAGQLAPGDWVEFEQTSRAEALTALAEQERALQHLERHAFT